MKLLHIVKTFHKFGKGWISAEQLDPLFVSDDFMMTKITKPSRVSSLNMNSASPDQNFFWCTCSGLIRYLAYYDNL